MLVSELSLTEVKAYLRVDGDSDNTLIEAILLASKRYCATYTGLTIEDLDKYEDITLAVLALCAELYDVRQYTVSSAQVNPTTAQILGSYCNNFL